MTLAGAPLQVVVCCTDLDRSRRFYRDTLGLAETAEHPHGIAFDAGGTRLFLSEVPDPDPCRHTRFGFRVDDLSATLASLAAKGLEPHRIEGIPHGEDGSVTAPDGSRVAWFADPDGTLFSLQQSG